LIDFFVFNATFSNISAISWRPVLVVEESGEIHRPWASNWSTLSLAAASQVIQLRNSLSHPALDFQRRPSLVKTDIFVLDEMPKE
jgi:hypothetical protein